MRRVWDVPYIVHNHDVTCVEVTRTIVDVDVVDVGNIRSVRRSVVEALRPRVGDSGEETLAESSLQVGLQRVILRSSNVLRFANGGVTAIGTQRIGIADRRIGLNHSDDQQYRCVASLSRL